MKRFRLSDLSLVVKIGFAPAFAVMMLALVAGGALWSQHRQSAVLERIVDKDMSVSARLLQASKSITAVHAALYQVLTRQAAGGSADDAQKSLTTLSARVNTIKTQLASIKTALPADQQAPFKGVIKDMGDYGGGIEVVGSMLSIDFKSAASFVEPFQAQYDRMTSALEKASQTVVAGSSARSQDSVRQANLNDEILLGVVVLTLAAVAGVAFTTVTGVRRAVSGISEATERLAGGDGDFDLDRLERGDELGAIVRSLSVFRDNQERIVSMRAEQETLTGRESATRTEQEQLRARIQAEQQGVVEALAGALAGLASGNLVHKLDQPFPGDYEALRADFNAAVTKLADAMTSVNQVAEGIRGGAGEISSASEDLSRRTENQAASLEQTAAALDEITATVRKTAEGAKQARTVVASAKSDAERSGEIVAKAVEAMGGIASSSHSISQIIGVIDEIAFQTNLLALNAGVEAARAGDAGRGFAVVAAEVRALAQRSAQAAKEIGSLISTSTQQVKSGVDLVGQTGKALDRIVAQVSEINGVVVEIAASAQEQATGLQEVNTAVNQMDQVTQQNAAMVEQTTAASHTLAQETETLAQLIGRFQIAPAAKVQTMAARQAKPAAAPTRAAMKTTGRGGAARKAAPVAQADAGWEEF